MINGMISEGNLTLVRLQASYFDMPATVNITNGPSLTKISRVNGKDTVILGFMSSEAFSEYAIKAVASSADPVTTGALLESGGAGAANVQKDVTLTDDELIAAFTSYYGIKEDFATFTALLAGLASYTVMASRVGTIEAETKTIKVFVKSTVDGNWSA